MSESDPLHISPMQRHERSWRLELRGNGLHIPFTGRTQDEVWDALETGLQDANVRDPDLTVSVASQLFVAERRDRGFYGPRSVRRARQDLERLWRAHPALVVRELGVEQLHGFLERMTADNVKLPGQRTSWYQVNAWLRWCVVRGLLQRNPTELVDRIDLPWASRRGQRSAGGKTQLANSDQAQAYLAAALAWPDRVTRVVAALPLLTGMRSGEVRFLRVDALDLGLSVLWIRGDRDAAWSPKTRASTRTVQIPDVLRDDLIALAGQRRGEELLLASPVTGHAWSPRWVWETVGRTCDAAKLPRVCPHGLRGTWASICVAMAQLPSPEIARLLGHADRGVTAERHYIGAQRPEQALRLIAGGKG